MRFVEDFAVYAYAPLFSVVRITKKSWCDFDGDVQDRLKDLETAIQQLA